MMKGEKHSHGGSEDDSNSVIAVAPQGRIVSSGPPPFRVASLWQKPQLNPLNLKAYSIPVFNLMCPAGRNFHLAWLGFFVAFFSWFAFPPLIPEAIRADLGLLPVEVANSNIVALSATLIMRIILGPLTDRYGPRKVMASILIIGAIPSGLAGTISSAQGLYVIRFFIGILGGTFVACQAWTTAFFDKSIVGTANALVGGWGNAGGGVVFIVQTALFQALVKDGLSSHSAWRAAFAIVPVPLLLVTAALTFIFGTDHPAGKWSQRHTTAATAIAMTRGENVHLDAKEKAIIENKMHGGKEEGTVTVRPVEERDDTELAAMATSGVDTAVNQAPTLKSTLATMFSPYTLLPALAYFTTFGFELVFDSNFANTLYAIYFTRGGDTGFTQIKAGYITAIFGLMNFFSRPLGGYIADRLYPRFGTKGKKYFALANGFFMGAMGLALGLYIDAGLTGTNGTPSLGPVVVLLVMAAFGSEFGNGAIFSLVPHCNVNANGVMTGMVGATGNLGGIFMALIFRYQPAPVGKPYWICGALCMAINALLFFVPVPKN